MPVKISEKQYQKEQRQLKEEIERKSGKTAAQLYAEREKRMTDATRMRVPDRVPIDVGVDMTLYTGVPNSAGYYDPIGFKWAMRKVIVDLEPDACYAGLPSSGAAMSLVDVKNRLWPGGPLPPDYGMQFVEGEWMKADEYDYFLNDPADFMLRRYLPRLYGALAPLAELPPLNMLMQGFEGLTPLFASPEFVKMAKTLYQAGQETIKFRRTIGDAQGDFAELGFPPFAPVTLGGVGGAPFDTLSSFLRGMQGSMVDIFRRPDKLLAACDAILKRRVANARPADPAKGDCQRVGMPLWRGDKSFMSRAQFEKFYWPGFKGALQATIDLGYVPVPFFEAEFGERLEKLLELPPGKIIANIMPVDAEIAKDILKGHTCIMVRTPLAAKVWTLNQLEEYMKNIIDKCGKGGGLILDIHLPDKGTKEEFQAFIARLKEYARY